MRFSLVSCLTPRGAQPTFSKLIKEWKVLRQTVCARPTSRKLQSWAQTTPCPLQGHWSSGSSRRLRSLPRISSSLIGILLHTLSFFKSELPSYLMWNHSREKCSSVLWDFNRNTAKASHPGNPGEDPFNQSISHSWHSVPLSEWMRGNGF